MANQAAKKAREAKAAASNVYLPLILMVNVVYLLWRGLYHYDTFGLWHQLGFVLTSALYYMGYNGIMETTTMNLEAGGYYFDLFFLTGLTQIACLFTDKGWFILLLVPGYIIFIYLDRLIKSTSQAVRTKVKQMQEARQLTKKEKKKVTKREEKKAKKRKMSFRTFK